MGHFKAVEYRPVGGVAADRAVRIQIAALGIRPAMRRTGLSQHTIEALLKGHRVRQATLERVALALASSDLHPPVKSIIKGRSAC